jgi:NADH-quinone oxidoreductase subunit H
LAAILFLGGWNGPIPLTSMLGLTDVGEPYAIGAALASFDADWGPRIAGYLGRLADMSNLIFKACLGVTVLIWVRWTLPRLRIDQVITTCLKYCTPIAAVMFVGACLWKVGGLPFVNDIKPQQDKLEVRESYLRTWGKPREEIPKTASDNSKTNEETAAAETTK